MRRILLIISALGAAAAVTVTAAASKHAAAPVVGTVTGAPSGDTIVVSVKTKKGKKTVTKQLRVPLLGVHAPAGSSCYATQSAAQLRSLAFGKRVTLTTDASSGWYVALPGGADLGGALIASGAAAMDTFNAPSTRIAEYVPLQEAAERNATGMWGACTADVSVGVTGPARGFPGDYLTYVATVTNNGPLSARGVNVELRPGSYAKQIESVATSLGTCASKGWVAYCAIEALGSSSSSTITLVIRAAQPGGLSARVTATSTGCTDAQCGSAPLQDPNLDNDRAAAFTLIPGNGYGLPGHECDPSYPSVCIPSTPPDLDCADFAPLRNFPVDYTVENADDHHLDGDRNGIACQGEDY